MPADPATLRALAARVALARSVARWKPSVADEAKAALVRLVVEVLSK